MCVSKSQMYKALLTRAKDPNKSARSVAKHSLADEAQTSPRWLVPMISVPLATAQCTALVGVLGEANDLARSS